MKFDFKKSGLEKNDYEFLKKLNSPKKIQDFLNKIPFNFEERGESYMSPVRVIKEKKAHCFEGALFAALALWINGKEPLLLDLKTTKKDIDHVVAIFKEDKCWGAISKTNHAVLRYREPIYKTIHELVMSYFHEYFLDDGKKTLRGFSKPFNVASKFGFSWITNKEELFDVVVALDESKHTDIVSKKQIKNLRKATKIEIKAGKIVEYKK